MARTPVVDTVIKGHRLRTEEVLMSLYMDVHTIAGGVSVADVADAHVKDLQTGAKYGVGYLRYWVYETAGKIFCLVEADSAETPTPFTGRRRRQWQTKAAMRFSSKLRVATRIWVIERGCYGQANQRVSPQEQGQGTKGPGADLHDRGVRPSWEFSEGIFDPNGA
jgi:hypothetical protein